MPRILYDHQAFWIQKHGGVSEYFYHVIRRIRAMSSFSAELTAPRTNNGYARELAGSESFFRMSDRFFFRGSGRIDSLLRKIHVLPDYEKTNREMALSLLSSDSFDVFHPTYYDDYFLANVKKPFVVTVFDMTHEMFPGFFPGQEIFLRQKKTLAERAAGIIAISSTTRDDLCEAYGLDPKKVQVSHLGGPAPTPVARGRGSHILYVGQRSIYKNFSFFLESIAPFLIKNEVRLIAAGGNPFTSTEKTLIHRLGVEKFVSHTRVSDDAAFIPLYRDALLFVFPSLYEGFGLPLLAAFAYGCPVACSNRGSLPEVAGDAAELFDPENSESILETVRRVAESVSLQTALREKGMRRAGEFSWDRCASEHAKMYASLI